MEKARENAIKVLNEFEELLDCHNINIPDEDREGHPTEARIFGRTWYNLEDRITELIKKF